jgi:hypothetical protein
MPDGERRGGVRAFAQIGAGITILDTEDTPSLLQRAPSVLSSSWAMGLASGTDDGGQFRLTLSQPVQIDSARFDYRLPAARTLDGAVQFANHEIDFGAASREIDLGLCYRRGTAKDVLELVLFAEARTGVAAFDKGREQRLGLRLTARL